MLFFILLEFPKWLAKLSSQPEKWDGVLLSSKVADQYNTLIKSKKATLLDLRNYIFLRQCKLLVKMKRKWDIPSRLLEFLFLVVHEFRLLDVSWFYVVLWNCFLLEGFNLNKSFIVLIFSFDKMSMTEIDSLDRTTFIRTCNFLNSQKLFAQGL